MACLCSQLEWPIGSLGGSLRALNLALLSFKDAPCPFSVVVAFDWDLSPDDYPLKTVHVQQDRTPMEIRANP